MHHHKSQFSRKRTKEGLAKKEKRQYSDDFGHHRGSSRKEGQRIHHMSDFIKSTHGHLKRREGTRYDLKSDATLMTDQIRDKTSTYDTGLKVSVDLKRCIRCGKCEKACPNGAIMVDEDIFRVDPSLCNGCGRCVDRCSEGALSLSENQEVFMNLS